jgi:type IV secretory pathway VirB2 component (pilin)
MTLAQQSKTRFYLAGLFLIFAFAFACDPALADGLEKVNTVMDNIVTVLRSVSIAAVTIAIMVLGYKLLFGTGNIRECLPLVGGCLLIGGASEFAIWLMS